MKADTADTARTSNGRPTGIGGALTRIGDALHRRDFRWWFGSQVLSSSGSMTQAVALSWVVLQQTGNAYWLSVLSVCAWGPPLLLPGLRRRRVAGARAGFSVSGAALLLAALLGWRALSSER